MPVTDRCLDAAFSAGAAAMRAAVYDWHETNGRLFADMAKKLERDRAPAEQVERARWASASHYAHASHVGRSALPVRAKT